MTARTSALRSRRLLVSPGPLAGALRAHPIVGFFGLTYAFSWLTLLGLYGVLRLPASLAILLQTIGPTFAAVVMLGTLEGAAGRRALVARLRIWRVSRRWYAFAVLGIPAVLLAAGLVLPGALAPLAGQSPVKLSIMYLIVAVVNSISGPLFEEPGWRGFALPHLQARLGALQATLLLGVMWAAWHLPQFLVPEWASQNGGSGPVVIVEFLLMVVAIAPVMTWLFNRTRGSLFMAIVAHSCINAALGVFIAAEVALAVGLLAFGALSIALLVATRGRLGYEVSPAAHA